MKVFSLESFPLYGTMMFIFIVLTTNIPCQVSDESRTIRVWIRPDSVGVATVSVDIVSRTICSSTYIHSGIVITAV